ncbi:hypothetical protein RHSIM_Rhsim07G0052000 [Rhododendron simsii]|uniref:Beta-glucosidase n=1 Tax=Rhododendron simsii TaxID=118357 RepID=A0A834H0P4_RHOSS|nr:hypothetical protein RHSIM_Rhsim07G0052000 [Rhododendron simsii]
MATQSRLVAGLMVVFLVCAFAQSEHVYTPFNRTSFPPGFVFGTASSAYQFEGAAKEGGKGPSIWDTFTKQFPGLSLSSRSLLDGKILNGSNGDVADDFYHRYKEDVQLLKFIGMDGFRFSISWSRVLPQLHLSPYSSASFHQHAIVYLHSIDPADEIFL